MADGDYVRLQCVDCRLEFVPSSGRGRPRKRCTDCSPEQKAPPGAYVRRLERAAECMGCRAAFTAQHGLQQYCSARCRNAANNRQRQERSRDRSARQCRFCLASFIPQYGDYRKAYCSVECRTRMQWKRTGGSTHRRRAKKFGCHYEAVDRLRVFDRDGWRCQLCGKATPRRLLGRRVDLAPELDHVVPLAAGGAHSFENTQCACRRCNMAKGATARGQLHLPLN